MPHISLHGLKQKEAETACTTIWRVIMFPIKEKKKKKKKKTPKQKVFHSYTSKQLKRGACVASLLGENINGRKIMGISWSS